MASGFKSLKGQLLLDGGSLQGSFFQRTVVLICEHDRNGAFGLVLNRDSGGKVGDLIVAQMPDALREQVVYLGGPVQPSALSYLHTDEFLLGANVLPNLALGHALESLVDIAGSPSPAQRVRVYAGYAGWAPGQLEQEMKRGAWLTHAATVDLVFHSQSEDLWKSIVRQKGWQGRLLAEAPDDLSWN